MVTDALLNAFEYVLAWVLALFPVVTVALGDGDMSALAAANWLLPISELFAALGIVWAYAVGSVLYVGLFKLVNLVRGSGA